LIQESITKMIITQFLIILTQN